MERITPVELERTQLQASFRGYNRQEVRGLIDRVSAEIERLMTELKAANEENSRLRQQVERFSAQETTLKEALVLAQKTADETRAQAHREADLIVEESRNKAATLQQELQSKVNDLRWEIERLRIDKQKFLNNFRHLLEEQLRELAEAQTHERGPVALLSETPDPDEQRALL